MERLTDYEKKRILQMAEYGIALTVISTRLRVPVIAVKEIICNSKYRDDYIVKRKVRFSEKTCAI